MKKYLDKILSDSFKKEFMNILDLFKQLAEPARLIYESFKKILKQFWYTVDILFKRTDIKWKFLIGSMKMETIH